MRTSEQSVALRSLEFNNTDIDICPPALKTIALKNELRTNRSLKSIMLRLKLQGLNHICFDSLSGEMTAQPTSVQLMSYFWARGLVFTCTAVSLIVILNELNTKKVLCFRAKQTSCRCYWIFRLMQSLLCNTCFSSSVKCYRLFKCCTGYVHSGLAALSLNSISVTLTAF